MRQLLAAMAAAVLAACTTADPNVIHPYEAQRLSYVYDATVLSVRPVTVDGTQSGLGATAGAVAGGVAGASVGHGGSPESFVGGVVGAVLGGVIGNAVERSGTRQSAIEIVVQLKNGERRAVVQGVTNETYAPGDPVVIVTTGGRTRVSHAPQAGSPAPAAYPAPAAAPAPQGVPVPAAYPNAPVQPVYPSGPVPPRT